MTTENTEETPTKTSVQESLEMLHGALQSEENMLFYLSVYDHKTLRNDILKMVEQTKVPQRTVFDDYVMAAMKAYTDAGYVKFDHMLPWSIKAAKQAMEARKDFVK